jgi:protein ImuB
MHWIAVQPTPKPSAEVAENANSLADVNTALAWWALRFTPMVARVDTALVLEVSGSERLFGGRDALLHELFETCPPDLPLDHAQGNTALLALGRLWAQATQAPIHTLPLHSLAAARAHLPTLMRLGCNTWGQLRNLPRGGLVRRFGAELVDALDLAYGTRPELYPWLTLPEVFDAPLELSAAVESASAMLFGARRLLAQLQVWLRARQRGVLALELLWELDARRSNALHMDAHHQGGSFGRLELRTAIATQDMQHLQRLLAEQLAQVTLPAPVLYLRMRSLQTQAMGGESLSLLPEDQRKGDSLHQMLERLGARLGPEQILCVQAQAQHAPEDMQSWQAWKPQTGKRVQPIAFLQTAEARLMPTWLLTQPLELAVKQQAPQYFGPLTLVAGPQRLETGWLEGKVALRDYFIASSAHAGLVWIYRERLPELVKANINQTLRWYLHGLFA